MAKTLRDMLIERGVLKPIGDGVKELPAQPAAPQVQYLPGVLDMFAQNRDQPAAPPVGELEQARQARLAQAARDAGANLTARERFEQARERMQAAGFYR